MKFGYLAAGIALVGLAGQAVAQGNSQNRGQGTDRTVQGQGNGGGQARGGPNAGNGQNRGNDNAGQGQGRSNAGNQGNRQASNGPSANPGRSNSQGQGNNRGQGNAGNRNSNAQSAQRGNRPLDRDIDRVLRDRDRDRRGGDIRLGYGDRPGRGLINGCPPGLAKKYNGCQPPGQARQSVWQRGGFYGYRSDDPFRILDGYLLRMGSGGRILGYDPLLGGALRIGNPWPEGQRYYDEPDYRRRYYGYGDNYRSYGNAVYRMDPETQAIASVAALLTGQDIAVGQPMPRGYDAYNVPYRYRSQYRDGPDGYYRYSDGYVYRLDPETRLVQAAIELLL